MIRTIFAISILLFSSSLWADWLKQDVQPEVVGRDEGNGCLFDEPVYLQIKANGGDTLYWVYEDSNGILFPITSTVNFSDSFKGLVAAPLPATGFDSVPNGGYFWITPWLTDAFGNYYRIPDRILSFVCPYL